MKKSTFVSRAGCFSGPLISAAAYASMVVNVTVGGPDDVGTGMNFYFLPGNDLDSNAALAVHGR